MKVLWGVVVIIFVVSLISCREDLIVDETESTRPGRIFVNSVPEGAAIYLNTWNVYKSTPDTLKNIYPGEHFVMLRYPGYRDTSVSVIMQYGGFSGLTLILTPD